jgi:hypothetical protein
MKGPARIGILVSTTLLVLNVFLAAKLLRASAEIEFLHGTVANLESRTPPPAAVLRSTFVGKIAPRVELPQVFGEGTAAMPGLGADSAVWHVLILFTPFDCLECFAEVPFWRQLRDLAPGHLGVLGVATGHGAVGIREFLQREKVGIPVFHDPEGELFEAIGVEAGVVTPLELLVGPGGVIFGADRSSFGDRNVEEAYERSLRLILGVAADSR